MSAEQKQLWRQIRQEKNDGKLKEHGGQHSLRHARLTRLLLLTVNNKLTDSSNHSATKRDEAAPATTTADGGDIAPAEETRNKSSTRR